MTASPGDSRARHVGAVAAPRDSAPPATDPVGPTGSLADVLAGDITLSVAHFRKRSRVTQSGHHRIRRSEIEVGAIEAVPSRRSPWRTANEPVMSLDAIWPATRGYERVVSKT